MCFDKTICAMFRGVRAGPADLAIAGSIIILFDQKKIYTCHCKRVFNFLTPGVSYVIMSDLTSSLALVLISSSREISTFEFPKRSFGSQGKDN